MKLYPWPWFLLYGLACIQAGVGVVLGGNWGIFVSGTSPFWAEWAGHIRGNYK